MNRFVLIMLASVCSLFAVEFHTLEEAQAIQKKNNKIIMLKMVRNDCHYCSDMQKEVCENEKY